MFTATRKWFWRNRGRFAIGLGALGAGYVATQYVLAKLNEARERMSSDRIARENLRRRFEQNQEDCTFTVLALLPTATENILEALPVENITNELQQKRAERLARSVGAGSEITPSEGGSEAPSITDDDGRSLQSFQSESYVHASQAGSEGVASSQRPRKTKAQLWHELKISSITRSFTLLYTLSLLTLLTRIQLNLLGRRSYLSSVVALASYSAADSTISLENHDDDNLDQAYGSDFETNRRYLTFSWWLLHRGWRDIMGKVETAVKEVFGSLNPREDIALERLSNIILEVRKKVEGETEEARRTKKWLPYLLPSREHESFVLHESGMTPDFPSADTSAPLLRRLLDETSDLIDSPTFTFILTKTLDSTFSLLTDSKLRVQAFKLPPLPTTNQSMPGPFSDTLNPTAFPDISDLPVHTEADLAAKAKVATVLAVLTRQAHAIGLGSGAGNGTSPAPINEYIQAIDAVRDLDAFAAVVYSSNFDAEVEVENPGSAKAPTRAGPISAAPDDFVVIPPSNSPPSQPQQDLIPSSSENMPSSLLAEETSWQAALSQSEPVVKEEEATPEHVLDTGLHSHSESQADIQTQESEQEQSSFESAWDKAVHRTAASPDISASQATTGASDTSEAIETGSAPIPAHSTSNDVENAPESEMQAPREPHVSDQAE
ncbi:Peroxin-3-domain-containing protein [Xylona heveae TC161]|uniref:Peroxin-3-domain-containing protein n=1 Tax=Xylona heveae (strain CBS 132557 / TC161) TaxID=1328760 RepID=A0A165GTG9_XYLHT|nr:Peroxin-3-domain-containing protein [Xylona heveae TC161]KZF22576.1 Peroxin-3-domain-containing protein [Xylona heveae TC161]